MIDILLGVSVLLLMLGLVFQLRLAMSNRDRIEDLERVVAKQVWNEAIAKPRPFGELDATDATKNPKPGVTT